MKRVVAERGCVNGRQMPNNQVDVEKQKDDTGIGQDEERGSDRAPAKHHAYNRPAPTRWDRRQGELHRTAEHEEWGGESMSVTC